MTLGLDVLGLAHPKFKAKLIIKLLPDGWALGVFDDPFGPVLPKLRQIMKRKNLGAVRIQAHWSNAHQIVPLDKLRKKLGGYQLLAEEFPHVPIFVSHSCEYDEPNQGEVEKRVDMIKRLAPSCIPVNSVMRGATVPGVITEHHGDVKVKPGEIVSHDGINCYDIDMEAWKEKNEQARICFLWGYRFNLRELTKPGQTPPPPMARTAAPSKEYVSSIVRLGFPMGLPPAYQGPGNVQPINKPRLLKSHGEDSQGHDDPRENKPVVIIEANHQIQVITWDGRKLMSVSKGGAFEGNLNRFYLRKWGYQIGRLALKKSGSEFVWFREGSKVWGPVNPAFRCGYFREF